MRFEFATAARIIFGPGTLAEIGTISAEFGRRALVVTGRDLNRSQRLRELLGTVKIETEIFAVAREPTIDDIAHGVDQARAAGCDFVIGFGGGSAIDAAKAIAVLCTNDGNPLDYLEVIGRAQPLRKASLPCIAIPTTAGTGSEVTRNAV